MTILQLFKRSLKGKTTSFLVLMFTFQCISIFTSNAQQVPDTSFRFSIHQPAYLKGKGPVILIDEAHHNFHTRTGGFLPFARLMEQDGYRVKSLDKKITGAEVLKECNILVIVNSLNVVNVDNWILPTPSAFTNEEIEIIRQWVENGGSLFLVADHMPFAGAATDLGKAFGFEFINGFAMTGAGFWPPSVFSHQNGTLQDSPVTRGLKEYEKIDSVVTFTGSALKVPEHSMRVLSFLDENISFQPDTAWRFNPTTKQQKLMGCQQGAILSFGKGKVAVFGEAAMFTAQLVNGNFRVGFNSELAPQNAQFALNLMHWLDGATAYQEVMLNEKLKFLKPLIVNGWLADYKSPDGKSSTKVIRRYESIWNGEVVKFSNSNTGLKYFEEGYFYLEDGTDKVLFFSVSNRGGAMKGEVGFEEGKITIKGQTTIRSKTFDYKNTIEFSPDGSMTDSWFQDASGSWKSGHVIEFSKTK